MFEKFLQDIGLNEKEAKVYLELLKLDDASVIEISKKTKINRTTVYNVIESLEEKGLVSETTLDKKTHYQAESPERLNAFVEKQRISYEEKAQRVKDIIPQLKSQNKAEGSRPVVRYFEGKDGIISAMNEFFAEKSDDKKMHMVYSKDVLDDVFTEKEQQYYRKLRINKGIKTKAVYNWRGGHRETDNTGKRLQVDSDKYPFTCDIAAYHNSVRISILGKERPSAILVQSEEFSTTMKNLIDLIFDFKKK